MSAYRSYSSLGLSAQAGQAAKHRTITLDAPEHEKTQRCRPEAFGLPAWSPETGVGLMVECGFGVDQRQGTLRC